MVVSSQGRPSTAKLPMRMIWNGSTAEPEGIATGQSNYVYVADTGNIASGGNDRIQKFTSDGKFVTSHLAVVPADPRADLRSARI